MRKIRLVIAVYVVLGIALGLTFYPLYVVSGKKKAFMHGRSFFGSNYFVTDRNLGWRLKPSVEVRSRKGGTLFKTDAFGFRNAEAKLPVQGKAMLFGDSLVQGYFLSASETIGEQLTSQIGGYVYNFGVGGYSVDQQFIVAREALKNFKTDWVVVVLSLYDLPFLGKDRAWGFRKPRFAEKNGKVLWDHFEPVISLPEDEPLFAPRTVNPYSIVRFDDGSYLTDRWSLYNLEFSHLFQFWKPRPFSKTPGMRLKNFRNGDSAYIAESSFRPELDIAFQFFEKLNELSKAAGAQLIVYLLPEAAQVFKADESFFAPQKYFQKACAAQKGFVCVEPHADYVVQQRQGDLYFRDDGHLSPRGAAFTAENLAKLMHAPSH